MRSPFARVKVLLSSSTLFRFSIQMASTGPSNTIQIRSPGVNITKGLGLNVAEGFPNGILYDELDIEVDKLKRNFLLSSLTKKVTKIKGRNDLRSLKV